MSHIPAPKREAPPAPIEASEAFRFLASHNGPHRFARVEEGIYRGGQPDRPALIRLRELGVRTVINLRRENRKVWRQEEATTKELGMRFQRFPFYGVFGAEALFLLNIVEEVKQRDVYVHCKHGRDRTSLIIALYRVLEEGWSPEDAWQREAIDYGSAQTHFYRQLRVVFRRMVDVRGR